MTAIPTWDQFMAPALRVLSDGEVHKARWICNAVADELGVTDEQRAELIPSGQPRYLNRSLWALSYLSRADAAERPKRGHYRITDAGRELLDRKSTRLNFSHVAISYAVFCLKKKKKKEHETPRQQRTS